MYLVGRYQLAGWVRADSAVTIAEDLAALAPLLGLPFEGTVSEIAAQVLGALRAQRGWLVVFDNAQRPGDLVPMLPGGRGHVLITSRKRSWSGIAVQVDLGEFSLVESVAFLCRRSGCDEPEAAGELAEALGNLPLALAQAAAYINTRSMTIRTYLELYRDPELARMLLDTGLDSAEYPVSVARTWLLSFTQLFDERPAAVELLRLCAFLDPDDIDLDLLSAGRAETGEILARALGNQLERTEAAGALAETSLVTVPTEGHLQVHRLVQAVTRDQLDDAQAAEWAKRALNLILAILPPDLPQDYQSWPAYAKLAPHIEAVVGHPSNYPILADKIILLRKLGVYLSASGQWRAARTICERILAIAEAANGPRDPEVAIALGNLGETQIKLGELVEAQTSIQRALDIFREAYGPDHYEVARALGNLSIVQRELGMLRDARTSIERALDIFQETYGLDNPEVAQTLVNLGFIQMDLGKLRDARTGIERALDIFQDAYGSNHPAYAGVLIVLSVVQLRLWKLRDAHTNFERAMPILQAVDEVYRRNFPEAPIDWNLLKRHKIIGFLLFVVSVYVAALKGWWVSRGGARRNRGSRQLDPAPDHQSGDDLTRTVKGIPPS
jgi:tetratricopeptide (TPR) repeat protein